MTGMHDIDTKHDAQGREFHRERLSAMMDDALSADESRFLLRRMEHDDELADCWQRWQFCCVWAKTCCPCLSNWAQFVRDWPILLLFYVYICSVCA